MNSKQLAIIEAIENELAELELKVLMFKGNTIKLLGELVNQNEKY